MASNLLAHNPSFEIQRKSTENVHKRRTPSAKPEKEEERRSAPGLFITSEDNLGLNLQHEFFPGATKLSKKLPFQQPSKTHLPLFLGVGTLCGKFMYCVS